MREKRMRSQVRNGRNFVPTRARGLRQGVTLV